MAGKLLAQAKLRVASEVYFGSSLSVFSRCDFGAAFSVVGVASFGSSVSVLHYVCLGSTFCVMATHSNQLDLVAIRRGDNRKWLISS